MSSGVEVIGADVAARAIEKVGSEAHHLEDANARLARVGADAARARSPVRTGELRGSIDEAADGTSASVTVGVRYWPFQDLGTRYVRAHRMSDAAAAAMSSAAPELYAAELRRVIERAT